MSGNKEKPGNRKAGIKPKKALHAYLMAQLAELDASLGRAVSGDAEAVHGARLALRRFRSAATVYRDYLPPLPGEDLKQLRELGRILGESRDAHLLARRLELALDTHPTWRRPAALRGFIGALDAHSAAQTGLLAGPDAQAGPWQRPVQELEAALTEEPPAKLGRKKAKAVLQKGWVRVQEHLDASMADASEDDHHTALHEMRKALKRLRYSTEAVSAAFPESSAALLEAITAQQKLLGEQHDAVVARDRLQRAAASHALDPADAAVLERLQAEGATGFEVEFYRVAGRDPVPEPGNSLTG